VARSFFVRWAKGEADFVMDCTAVLYAVIEFAEKSRRFCSRSPTKVRSRESIGKGKAKTQAPARQQIRV